MMIWIQRKYYTLRELFYVLASNSICDSYICMYNGQWNEDYEETGQINSIAEDYEYTSSSFGKTVNESQHELTENSIDKIAVNTSKMGRNCIKRRYNE